MITISQPHLEQIASALEQDGCRLCWFTIPNNINPVTTGLGLPESSLPSLAAALQGIVAHTTVEGLTPEIHQAVQEPFRLGFAQATSTVFLVTLVFTGAAIILACFTMENDKSTEHYVAGNVHKAKDEKTFAEAYANEKKVSTNR
ncbi:hypothetical protein Slin15195_G048420 [Septoria linicola]|uniref:Uncharacterized protein n=1 Tax=Septoria linicola TaxID=215465 RepID=A0A9Q9ASV9_9PEZI|nr:hypothetical protein Slin14017_G051990 [Septoria linicola]USW51523.1 hypothetical protein Slin15195_G048420 [Septoria linicola]